MQVRCHDCHDSLEGLEPLYLLTEPTAAAYAYGMTNARQIQKFMVVDFGGGTLDISILQQLENGTFNVLATEGDVILGGDDVTQKVADFCVEQWKDDISKLTEQKRLNVMRRIWKEVRATSRLS